MSLALPGHTILSQRPLGIKRCTVQPMRTLLQEFSCSGCAQYELSPDELSTFLRALPVETLLEALGARGVVYPVASDDNPFLGMDEEPAGQQTHAHDEDGVSLCRHTPGNDLLTNLEELVTCAACIAILEADDVRAELRRLNGTREEG